VLDPKRVYGLGNIAVDTEDEVAPLIDDDAPQESTSRIPSHAGSCSGKVVDV
jgi:hypothetical protein